MAHWTRVFCRKLNGTKGTRGPFLKKKKKEKNKNSKGSNPLNDMNVKSDLKVHIYQGNSPF